jgi:hypothetical protein
MKSQKENNFRKRVMLISLIGMFVMVSSCKREIGNPPIAKDKMAEIVTEIYMTKIALETTSIPPKAQKNYYYCNIFERHGITEETFDSAVAWYASNMSIFEQVYSQVISNLKDRRAALDLESGQKEQ